MRCYGLRAALFAVALCAALLACASLWLGLVGAAVVSALLIALGLRPLAGMQLQQPAVCQQGFGQRQRLAAQPVRLAQHRECRLACQSHVQK